MRCKHYETPAPFWRHSRVGGREARADPFGLAPRQQSTPFGTCAQCASGSGRTWNFTAFGAEAFRPSMFHGEMLA